METDDTSAAMKKDVAVIILNWNGESLLRQYIPGVIDNTPSQLADIIVADNGSTDNSLQLLRQSFPEVKILPFETNLGYAEGYNRAVKLTGYRYTVLLNSDVLIDSDWLTPLYNFISRNSDVAALQPKILSIRQPGKFEYAGAAGGYLDRNGYPYCRGRIFNTIEDDNGQYDDTADVDWASGACLMVDTRDYLNAGGLDSSFFAHMEEIDLCWRLKIGGKRVCAIGDSHVRHLGGASLSAGNPFKTYLNFRNNLIMLHKNLPSNLRNRIILRRRLLDTLAWGKMILSGDFKNARALWKAHRDYAAARAKILATPGADSQPLMLSARPDIISQYYIGRRCTYSRLRY